MLRSKSSIYKQSDDHIYYNIELSNSEPSPLPLRYVATRTQPLFDGHPEDYVMSITRFQVPLSSIPLMVYPKLGTTALDLENPLEGQPDDTQWYVKLVQGASSSTAFIEYFPHSTTVNTLSIYSIQHFVDLVNDAFYRAGQGLAAPTADVPYLYYDEDRGIIDIYATNTWNLSINPNNRVFLNSLLYDFFNNFPSFYFSNLLEYQILIQPNGNNLLAPVNPVYVNGNTITGGANGINTRGEFPNLGQLYSVRSIVFTSANLPVKHEYIPNNVSSSNINDTANGFRNIITDFEINLEGINGRQVRTIQNYNSQGEYRLSDLSGTTGIKTIDIQVYWSDNRGRLFTLTINQYNYFSMKILFRKKTYKSAI